MLDASVALTWFFKDERTPRTIALLRRAAEDGAIVPVLFHYEVASGLLLGVRRSRLSKDIAKDRLSRISRLGLEVDAHDSRNFGNLLALAEETQLTPYDAAYLDLAIRRALPLATDDKALKNAAAPHGVSVL